jgi:hypothetical protein
MDDVNQLVQHSHRERAGAAGRIKDFALMNGIE